MVLEGGSAVEAGAVDRGLIAAIRLLLREWWLVKGVLAGGRGEVFGLIRHVLWRGESVIGWNGGSRLGDGGSGGWQRGGGA